MHALGAGRNRDEDGGCATSCRVYGEHPTLTCGLVRAEDAVALLDPTGPPICPHAVDIRPRCHRSEGRFGGHVSVIRRPRMVSGTCNGPEPKHRGRLNRARATPETRSA